MLGERMNYSAVEVKAACGRFAPKLWTRDIGVDPARLLWAIAGQESSYGADCGPRFEPGYWSGEESLNPVQSGLNARFGRAAAMSYGPWQVMYINAYPLGTPEQLDANLDLATQAAVHFLNGYVLGVKKAKSLQEIAQIYNSGCLSDPMKLGVLRYVENVTRNYENAGRETT